MDFEVWTGPYLISGVLCEGLCLCTFLRSTRCCPVRELLYRLISGSTQSISKELSRSSNLSSAGSTEHCAAGILLPALVEPGLGDSSNTMVVLSPAQGCFLQTTLLLMLLLQCCRDPSSGQRFWVMTTGSVPGDKVLMTCAETQRIAWSCTSHQLTSSPSQSRDLFP